MSLRSFYKVLLASIMAVAVWCVPAQPAYGAPDKDKLIDIDKYDGPALEELRETQQFVTPFVKDLYLLLIDYYEVTAANMPDEQIKAYEQMQKDLEKDNVWPAEDKAEIAQALSMHLQDAKNKKQLGETLDPATMERNIKAMLPSYCERLRKLDTQMYDGLKPRLFGIADKDAELAVQLGASYTLLEIAIYMFLQLHPMMSNEPCVIDLTKDESKLVQLCGEIDQYAKQIKGQQ